MKWQRTQRLVGSAEPRWIVDNIILDSLLFHRVLPPAITRIADVGSGAGVPGIPLKIVMPEVEVDLIESRQRRASFLSTAIREIPLPTCRVINGRVEDLAAQLSGRYDAVVMRCAGPTERLLRDVRAIVSPGGVVVVGAAPAARASADAFSGDTGEAINVPTGSNRTRTFRRFRMR
jgi:16S rRNA (guanine527-N7)-methyltransferase